MIKPAIRLGRPTKKQVCMFGVHGHVLEIVQAQHIVSSSEGVETMVKSQNQLSCKWVGIVSQPQASSSDDITGTPAHMPNS
jgi:hypothetical protein